MNPLQNGPLTTTALANRVYAWRQLDQGARSAQLRADEILEVLRRDAQAAGLGRELAQLIHPPAPVIPIAEPTVRVKALRPFKVMVRNRYGEHEEFSAAATAVWDVPQSCLRGLGDRVERVPDDTALRHLPLGTDDYRLLALDE